ncbi:MAG: hypothetical protein OEU26_31270 [Candidatus Tectomicrobia bacterium]|nr:hypothetical protein [Candidatus Tectomicrobia bacterium]
MALGRTSKAADIRVQLDHPVIDADGPMVEYEVEEAYELVHDGLMTEADFRDFVFANPANLYAETNPDFFQGTAVEGAVATLLSPS